MHSQRDLFDRHAPGPRVDAAHAPSAVPAAGRTLAANRKRKGRKGGRPVDHDAELYKVRNTDQRLINKLKAWRGIATRYDKKPLYSSWNR
ncbi:hypothetical protein ABZ251_19335 [Streptomyces chartreusis]